MPNLIRDRSELSSAEALSERLRLALDFSDVGEWVWDADTDLVDLSPVACEVFGCPRGTRMTWARMQAECLHPDDAPIAAAAVIEAIHEKSPYRVEYRSRRQQDQREAWVAASGKALYDDLGQPTGMVGLVQDITERKLQQLALDDEVRTRQQAEAELRRLAEELEIRVRSRTISS